MKLIKKAKKTEAAKQLIKFRNQLHNLLIKYPEIRLKGDTEGDIYAQITPNELHTMPEYVYLPKSSQHELIIK